jgi:hypothetical protein
MWGERLASREFSASCRNSLGGHPPAGVDPVLRTWRPWGERLACQELGPHWQPGRLPHFRACVGLREARLAATVAGAMDGPAGVLKEKDPWLGKPRVRERLSRCGSLGGGTAAEENRCCSVDVGINAPTTQTYPTAARVSNRFCAEFFSTLKPAFFSSLPPQEAPATPRDTWQTLPLLRPGPAGLLSAETGCGRLPHPASLPTASKAL